MRISKPITIEAKRGQYRIKNGKATGRYASDYGEIKGTRGADGMPLDVYVGLFHDSDTAYIINQYIDGKFDEHKIMLNFYNMEQAVNCYRISTGHNINTTENAGRIIPVSKGQLEWWLEFGNHKKPVSKDSLPHDTSIMDESNMETMDELKQLDWENEQYTASNLIYQWRKTDDSEELLEAASLDDLIASELEDGAEFEEDEAVFDALVIPKKKLEHTAQILGKAFNRTGSSLKVADDGIFISKPMKQNGTTNIVIMFEITDGQTISVFLHNPDTTPQTLAPDDALISWKWLLNRKDITIAVAKENGKDLPVQTVARRVMALLEKNALRFAKANTKRQERVANLQAMEQEIAQKEQILEDLYKQIEEKKAQVEQKEPISGQNLGENAENEAQNVSFPDAAIQVLGNELGEFDLTTEQGKQALRQAAFDKLTRLVESGETVYCHVLKADVHFSKAGVNKFQRFSGDIRKVKLAAQIKKIIANGEKFKESSGSYQSGEAANNTIYHYLKTPISIDGELYSARVVIREDNMGNFYWDLRVPDDVNAIMDSTKKSTDVSTSLHKGDRPTSVESAAFATWDNHTAIFDDSSSSYVLNLFLFDANDNEVSDKNQSNTDEIQSFLNDFKNDISHSVEEESQLERLQGVAEQLDTNHVHYPLLEEIGKLSIDELVEQSTALLTDRDYQKAA